MVTKSLHQASSFWNTPRRQLPKRVRARFFRHAQHKLQDVGRSLLKITPSQRQHQLPLGHMSNVPMARGIFTRECAGHSWPACVPVPLSAWLALRFAPPMKVRSILPTCDMSGRVVAPWLTSQAVSNSGHTLLTLIYHRRVVPCANLQNICKRACNNKETTK